MPESLLGRRFMLGRFLGIGLYVHWTFALVIAYVAMVSSDTGVWGMAFAVIQLLGIFLCVTLHEYGHAIAARQFGISTADITLLPIGGVARLKRMPRIPWQELVIAVAGPAVNVAIAVSLFLLFFVLTDGAALISTVRYFVAATFGLPLDERSATTVSELFQAPSLAGFAITMLIVNLMLVVFNLIPAFPMDGGRVFRSVLAMGIDYRRATRIASRLGLACAGLLAVLALTSESPNFILVLIAVFVAYAGMAEARQVDVLESVRGLKVGDVMVPTATGLPMDTTLGDVVARYQATAVTALPVVSSIGTVVGMLPLGDVRRAIAEGVAANATAGQLIDRRKAQETVHVSEPLEAALMRGQRAARQIPVVDDLGQLCGVIDLETLVIRSELAKQAAAYRQADSRGQFRFDQST